MSEARSLRPSVSVGMPVYNGERYIRLALDSILRQDFENFELIVSDNASTDQTSDICAAYAKMDNRIRYYRNAENIGSAPNYNRTFHLASGKFFKWCAHDDICRQHFLAQCVEAMQAAPSNVAIVYPQCDLIDASGNVFARAPHEPPSTHRYPFRRLAHVLRNVGYAYPLWGLIRSDHLRRTRLLTAGAQNDYVLLAELALQGEFWELPEALFELRMHANNAWAICSEEQGDVAWRENAKANKRSRERLLAWTDTKSAHRTLWLPFYEDLYWRYLNGVRHAAIPFVQKLMCYVTVPIVCYFRRVKNWGAVRKRNVLRRLSQRG